ncbi:MULTISPECIES: SDR family oxidoreductase [unclassified Paenibacillus]|uniref:SDR family oxidoreductase n=1 Tax=unclassified Paenibacillus TaxID=185978 RepID=UPI0004F8F281|nr:MULTISPECIES: SDR family oxidoreductase [unclassified Paenibacillus]AIQ32786.1 3-ketoacyl-ACP reductase [Paenibacillus sp. FSL P4-0081]AIQ44089.1 3-ketoacyl-ACP reductase [Paenibacillus sp. FSL R5-0912]
MTQPLQGKVAIVTGSSRGIGRSVAERLAEQGASVIINYSSSPAQADDVVTAIRAGGGTAAALQADISKPAQIEQLFKETKALYGKIDIVVNNAGIMMNSLIGEATEEQFDKQFAINVKGTYFSCQQAFYHLEQGGRIINFSTSVNGQMFPAYSIYAGTKGAVEQFTRQLAKEFGSKGITINAVAPGPVATELFLEGKSEAVLEGLKKGNAFGRLGQPEDIAGVVSFLAGEDSGWITGQTLRVNGGFI